MCRPCRPLAFEFVVRYFTQQSQLISDNESLKTKDLHIRGKNKATILFERGVLFGIHLQMAFVVWVWLTVYNVFRTHTGSTGTCSN